MSQKLAKQTAPSASDSAQDAPPTRARTPYEKPRLDLFPEYVDTTLQQSIIIPIIPTSNGWNN
ncbi:MAG: hypothetical protein U5L04_09300 [Trueperaceae bacterium]|nr:hypothetical protein [Trueperaceae bacterium]